MRGSPRDVRDDIERREYRVIAVIGIHLSGSEGGDNVCSDIFSPFVTKDGRCLDVIRYPDRTIDEVKTECLGVREDVCIKIKERRGGGEVGHHVSSYGYLGAD